MGHLSETLTENIEIGAVRVDGQDGLEIVKTDSQKEVRNARTDADPRMWEIALPMVDIEGGDTTDYDAVRQLWTDSERGLHTFDFNCFVDDETVKVRFDGPLQFTAPAGHLRKIDTFNIVEVFE